MKLDLQCISACVDDSKLTVIHREMTEEDCEHYDKIGWKNFNEESLIDRLLPSFGDPIYFSSKHSLYSGVVVEIRGIRYLVQFDEEYSEEPYEPKNKSLTFTVTDKPLTKPDAKERGHSFKFFGQPTWIQNEYFPADPRDNACYHFVTIENGWGDSGNYNILLGMDGDIPSEAYFEASCC
jgi:hypothetical protein